MMSREVGSAAVIRGWAGSPRRPTPRPTGRRYPLVGPCAYALPDLLRALNRALATSTRLG